SLPVALIVGALIGARFGGFIAALLHEAGHGLAAWLSGYNVQFVRNWRGGWTVYGRPRRNPLSPLRPLRESHIRDGGPLASLAVLGAGLWYMPRAVEHLNHYL